MANGPEHSMASWDGRLFLKSAHWASESCLSETRFLRKQRKEKMSRKQEDKKNRGAEQDLPTTLAVHQWRLGVTVLQDRCPSLAGFLVMSLINSHFKARLMRGVSLNILTTQSWFLMSNGLLYEMYSECLVHTML